jgi:hypothetical protein
MIAKKDGMRGRDFLYPHSSGLYLDRLYLLYLFHSSESIQKEEVDKICSRQKLSGVLLSCDSLSLTFINYLNKRS